MVDFYDFHVGKYTSPIGHLEFGIETISDVSTMGIHGTLIFRGYFTNIYKD